MIFDKNEHRFEIADLKVIFENSVNEVLDETKITKIDKDHILCHIKLLLDKWL
jgi:hypothetical protein